MPDLISIKLKVNGTERRGEVEPRKLLVDFLREDLGLTGAHVGCEHGVCGACTVLFNGEAVRSCLLFAVQAEGAEILTVESLASGGRLHPLQQAFHEHYGLQCGFCTPGLLMAVLDFLQHGEDFSEEGIRRAISGNICRCTGYQSIVDSVKAAVEKMRDG